MSNLYQAVSLPFADDLVFYTKKHMMQYNTDRVHIQDVPVPKNEWNDWNSWLESKKISKLLNILSFKKKQYLKNITATHIDYYQCNTIVHNSIVIPVEGCKNTFQYWYGGRYTTEKLSTDNGSRYMRIHWMEIPKLLDSVEIFNSPVLCRTDIPHNIENIHNEYRTTVTIRFEANESFEYLAERLSK